MRVLRPWGQRAGVAFTSPSPSGERRAGHPGAPGPRPGPHPWCARTRSANHGGAWGHVDHILTIPLWQHDALYASPLRCQQLFLHPPHWQNLPAQGNFASHGHRMTHRCGRERRNEGNGERNTSGGAVFRNRPSWDVDMEITLSEDRLRDAQVSRPRARITQRRLR